MFEPVRGGTRGGQAEFKWSEVSADKDRENYLGHSINAPTGRWQKNKDIHWYNRDVQQKEERDEEIRKIKEAEAEALSIALGYGPTDKNKVSGGGSIPSPSTPAIDKASRADLPSARESLEKEERRRRKAERKEEKRAKKEKRLTERKSNRRNHDDSSPRRRRMSSSSPIRHPREEHEIFDERQHRPMRSPSPVRQPRRMECEMEDDPPEGVVDRHLPRLSDVQEETAVQAPTNARLEDVPDRDPSSVRRRERGNDDSHRPRRRSRSRSRSPRRRGSDMTSRSRSPQSHRSRLRDLSRPNSYDAIERDRDRDRDRRRWEQNSRRESPVSRGWGGR